MPSKEAVLQLLIAATLVQVHGARVRAVHVQVDLPIAVLREEEALPRLHQGRRDALASIRLPHRHIADVRLSREGRSQRLKVPYACPRRETRPPSPIRRQEPQLGRSQQLVAALPPRHQQHGLGAGLVGQVLGAGAQATLQPQVHLRPGDDVEVAIQQAHGQGHQRLLHAAEVSAGQDHLGRERGHQEVRQLGDVAPIGHGHAEFRRVQQSATCPIQSRTAKAARNAIASADFSPFESAAPLSQLFSPEPTQIHESCNARMTSRWRRRRCSTRRVDARRDTRDTKVLRKAGSATKEHELRAFFFHRVGSADGRFFWRGRLLGCRGGWRRAGGLPGGSRRGSDRRRCRSLPDFTPFCRGILSVLDSPQDFTMLGFARVWTKARKRLCSRALTTATQLACAPAWSSGGCEGV
eukprot:scaffold140_cov247-Pinguiococcus_pyrenoidosus.AAC.4